MRKLPPFRHDLLKKYVQKIMFTLIYIVEWYNYEIIQFLSKWDYRFACAVHVYALKYEFRRGSFC